MAEQNNDNTARASVMGAYLMNRQNRALENVREQYANDKHHDFNVVKEDALARREEYQNERQHIAQVELEKSITTLTNEMTELEKSGDLARAREKKNEIGQLRREGSGVEDTFDTDELSKNFASTLDEVIEDFGTATRDEMKVSINRMSALMDSIQSSNAVEKDFLLEQYKQTQDAMQKEFNKRANIAARATEKMSELGEQYLDIQSLYAGFVDHNPIMMAMFKMGSDFIRRSRESKKAQSKAILRDKKNQAYAEKLNAEKSIRADLDAKRDDEINTQRQETLRIEREAAEKNKSTRVEQNNEQTTERESTITRETESTSTPSFDLPQDEYSDTGDAALPQNELAQIFGETDEDGDSTGFTFEREYTGNQVINDPTIEGDEPLTQNDLAQIFGEMDEDGDPTGMITREEPEPVYIDDSTPLNVKVQEETPEQKAQDLFVRQEAQIQHRVDEIEYNEQKLHNESVLGKLTDIESAILNGNKITGELGEPKGGLLEALGLGRIAAMFKGPILKAMMLFAPIVTAIGTLLSKLGLGSLGGKLTGGFDNMAERMGGDRNARQDRANQRRGGRRGGRFSRMINGAKDLGGRAFQGAKHHGGKFVRAGANVARAGGGMAMRGGSMVARGAMGLLGTTAGAVTAAGAAGYGVGTLINDHVLSDDTKEGIGDFIGPKIDSVLSLFGNEDAQRRLEFLEKQKQQNGQTMGIEKADKPLPYQNAAESMGLDNYDKAPNDVSVMEKEPSGGNLVIKADNINSNKVVNSVERSKQIEVPVQRATEEKLQMLEQKVVQLQDAKAESAKPAPIVTPPPAPSKQNIVKSEPSSTAPQGGRSARNDDSSIQRLTDRFVGMGMA